MVHYVPYAGAGPYEYSAGSFVNQRKTVMRGLGISLSFQSLQLSLRDISATDIKQTACA